MQSAAAHAAGGPLAARTGGATLVLGRLLVAALYFTISTDVLIVQGFQYQIPGGSPLDKLHPATWLSLFLLVVLAARWGNPVTGILRLADRHIDYLPYFLAILFMIGYVTLVTKSPFTIFVETFLAPLVIVVLFAPLDEREGRRLARLLHVLLLANALLGIYEMATGDRLTPYLVQGEPMLDDWRSTALFGHPLANAATMGSYILALALGGHRDLPFALALTIGTICLASMVAFGGRAATALVLAGLLLIALTRLMEIFAGRRFAPSSVLWIMIVAPLLAGALYLLHAQGFFDLFLERITDDSGSASTRLKMFELLNHLNWSDLLLKPDTAHIETWVGILGLEYGIENFVLSFILSYGLVASVVFLSALVHFCLETTRRLHAGAGWVFVYFFAVALTSVSLSAKTPLFTMLIVLLVVLMRPRPAAAQQR